MKLNTIIISIALFGTSTLSLAEESRSALVTQIMPVEQVLQESMVVYGRVQADPDSILTLSLPHAGLITKVSARLGQRVKRGDMLLEITTSPAARMEL